VLNTFWEFLKKYDLRKMRRRNTGNFHGAKKSLYQLQGGKKENLQLDLQDRTKQGATKEILGEEKVGE